MKKRIAAIDIGTTKVCTIMGILDSTSGLRVLGVGIASSHGIEKALIADAAKAKASIQESIRKAEIMAGYRLDSAYIGVTGRHISSMNSKGSIAITRSDMMVREEDLKRGLDVALNVQMQGDQKILHVIPRSYRLDGHEVKNPVGMNGSELEVEVHVITASTASVQNLTRIIKGINVNVEDLILEPLASAEAALAEEEKLAGVLLADIGGGTTDIAIIKDGSIYHSSVIPAAGNQITNDLVAGLGINVELAEEMKKKYGTLIPLDENIDPDKRVGENGQNVNFTALCEIIQARVEELIRLIILDIPGERAARLIPAGIVLTGGCANTPGIAQVAEKLTKMPVRIGTPIALNGVSVDALSNPAYATSVGLILYSMKNKGTSNWFSKRKGFKGLLDQVLAIFR
jgi:cell division protein FtsA